MRLIDFPSKLNGDKIAFRLSSEWSYDTRGSAPLSLYLLAFETYGEGLTQHSGAWTVQWPDLTDACISLALAVVANPTNEAWKQLGYVFNNGSSATSLEFYRGIKYREGKPQRFNRSTRKVTTSESKRYDTRWEEVESWMDGTARSVLNIILKNTQSDWLQRLCVATDVREAFNYVCWEDFFPAVSAIKGDWYQAFAAARSVARAVSQLEQATNQAESAIYNSTPKEAATEVA